MRTEFCLEIVRNKAAKALTFVFVLCILAAAGPVQAQQAIEPAHEVIEAGTLVIPMESFDLNNAQSTKYNVRAYGLANFLRDNNVPVKWAVNPGTASEGVDLVATVTRISGNARARKAETKTFPAGAFVVAAEYDNPSLRDLISTFNSAGTEVDVYRTTEPTTAEIRNVRTLKSTNFSGANDGNVSDDVREDLSDAVSGSGPCACQPNVYGYKSVRRSNIRSGGPTVVAGDTLEWTIDYVNNSPVDVSAFNIRDEISAIDGELTGNLTLVPGSNIVTVLSGGANATRNASYDGIGDDSTSDLLAPGAILPIGGRIQVKVQTTINMSLPGGQPYPDGQILYNQTLARGNQITGVIKSDAIDWTNTTIFGIDIPPADSLLQLQDANILNSTIARIKAPTRADAFIEGQVRTAKGNPIMNALVTVTSAASGAQRTVRSNAQGNFMIEELEVGVLYIVTVQHKRYVFDPEPIMFTLVDNMTGLAFIGVIGEVSEDSAPIRPVMERAGR